MSTLHSSINIAEAAIFIRWYRFNYVDKHFSIGIIDVIDILFTENPSAKAPLPSLQARDEAPFLLWWKA